MGIHLPMQGTQVQSLVREDCTCHEATKAVHHILSSCSRALEPQLLSLSAAATKAQVPRASAPVFHHKGSYRNAKTMHHNKEQPPLTTTRETLWAAMGEDSAQPKRKKETKGLSTFVGIPHLLVSCSGFLPILIIPGAQEQLVNSSSSCLPNILSYAELTHSFLWKAGLEDESHCRSRILLNQQLQRH